jgi:hypothetical protein
MIEATNVTAFYLGMGLLTAGIAVAFACSPVRDGDCYLVEAKQATDRAVTTSAEKAPLPT